METRFLSGILKSKFQIQRISKMGNNRRDFIKKLTLAVGSSEMTMTAKSYNSIIGANERLNIAFAGLGRRLNAFKELSP